MRVVMIGLLLLILSSAEARAQLIVGSDDGTDPTIYHIDVATGVATPILEAPEAIAWGLAYDIETNTLYWNNGGTLYRSPFGVPLAPVNMGTMTFMAVNSSYVGLAFFDGKLYGTKNIADEAVYEINLTTLDATIAYNFVDADFDFGGIDIDAVDGKMYGTNDDSTPLGTGLFFIDPLGMTEVLRAPYPMGATDIDGLAVHDGLAYLVIDEPGDISVVDIAAGTIVDTLPSPFPNSAVFSAGAFVPSEDGDLIPDLVDNCPEVSNVDQADADGDGVGDVCDECPDDANKTEPGICGCGVADGDTDGDGFPDCFDLCPDDAAKTGPGVCGCGVADDDADGDGIFDCVDNCPGVANGDQVDSDGDGVGDACLAAPAGQACCGGGLPAVLPVMMLCWRRFRRTQGTPDR